MGTAIEQMALARQTGKIGKKIAGAADIMARTYKAEDDFFKILAYEIELVQYKRHVHHLVSLRLQSKQKLQGVNTLQL